jgi:hypothetical protein
MTVGVLSVGVMTLSPKMEVNDIIFFSTNAHWDYSIDDITLSQV